MRTKDVKGITIISLVVTIVVILILAGVTINVLVGDNGLIKQSKDKTSQAYEKIAREEVKQIVTEYDIANSGESLEEYLKKKFEGKDVRWEKTVLEDGTIVFDIQTSGIKQRYTFTEL